MGLIVIRHPETEQNRAKVFPDYTDAAYTATGQRQLEAILAEDFKADHIFSSPLSRATRLAGALAKKYSIDFTIDERLREIDLGHFAGLSFEEIKRYYPNLIGPWMADPWHFQYPRGESYPQLKQRVLSFLETVPKASILCTHQAVSHVIALEFGDDKPLATGEWRQYAY